MIHVPSGRCHRHPGKHQQPRAGRAGPELEPGCVSTTSASPGRPGEHPSHTAEPSQRHQPIQNQRFGERWDKKGEAAATPAPVGAHITGRPRPEPVFEGDKASSSWEFPEGFFIHGFVPSLGAEEVGVRESASISLTLVTSGPHKCCRVASNYPTSRKYCN